MSINFNRYSQFYDLLYAGKQYQQEVNYLDRHIRQILPQATTILELGSGTGNHASFMSGAGYTITGVERSAEMASISRGKNIRNFEVVEGDMADFTLDQTFDAAISVFHSICYLTTNDVLLDCLSAVYRHLNRGGIFCFDFWHGPAVLHDLPGTRVKKINTGELDLTRIAETEMCVDQNLAIVNYQLIARNVSTGKTDVFSEQHPMRYLSVPEIDLLANQSGFTVKLCERFLDGGKPGLDTWNAFCILQKID